MHMQSITCSLRLCKDVYFVLTDFDNDTALSKDMFSLRVSEHISENHLKACVCLCVQLTAFLRVYSEVILLISSIVYEDTSRPEG